MAFQTTENREGQLYACLVKQTRKTLQSRTDVEMLSLPPPPHNLFQIVSIKEGAGRRKGTEQANWGESDGTLRGQAKDGERTVQYIEWHCFIPNLNYLQSMVPAEYDLQVT